MGEELLKARMRLSICIATLNRATLLAETLASIANQMTPEVELVIVDGASTDETEQVVSRFASFCHIRYFREQKNSGLDIDYDKAVSYAKGEFCWLMTDDDLLRPHAISTVLANLDDAVDLVVVNAIVKDVSLRQVIRQTSIKLECDATFRQDQQEQFFSAIIGYLSFIGSVVVRRSVWMYRDRQSYYGSMFVHVGVIFQDRLAGLTRVIADPLIIIRYGNATWTHRTFEIWVFKWPRLIWSFSHFTELARASVCQRAPWERSKTLLLYRGLNSFDYRKCKELFPQETRASFRAIAMAVSLLPVRLVNGLVAMYLFLFNRGDRIIMYDLATVKNASFASRWIARHLQLV
jgi:abequosyltransferase